MPTRSAPSRKEQEQSGPAREARDEPAFAAQLLEWYDRHARSLPWRTGPKAVLEGRRSDPYHVWLSEIMLQQTQVATVRDYFLKFLQLWPTVQDLAEAETEAVMKAWAGLGYYSRARNLKKCAAIVADELGSNFPVSAAELRRLPGIGDYTSAAIAAIAFDEPVPVVDGNVERVVARFMAIATPLPAAKKEIRGHVARLMSGKRPGDFAQAMMDLGATLCSPRNPACGLCPVRPGCRAAEEGTQTRFPVKRSRPDKPVRKGAAFLIQDAGGAVFLQKRPEKGLLGGMTGIPTTNWSVRQDGATGESALPFDAQWKRAGIARHSFTHFHLELEVWQTIAPGRDLEDGWWCPAARLGGEALPAVMKKAIAAALPDAFRK